ncbi:protein SODIUM POTASSIUM ROOT DEFECTIVE 1-like [Mangifera indica]|uniref:protein SODIUM POTASSIUM ROOT DEFECTIVE 1-like n=1 Tax=Mangifera indica TaxID=29780 RepID=UPI001CF941B7|nr:protein SODIUM POTASSIUM ROOT DEFECTIVE 1-like [Mangifera indica]
MRGFMCQSVAATTACMVTDPRSIVVPTTRCPNRYIHFDHHDKRLKEKSAKYSRLTVPSVIKREQDLEQEPKLKPLNKVPPSPPVANSSTQLFQVVVMRVSLHCQGCAGKVKKHLSKMEGVTSFSIDVETKRVTVMGHVSPARVLESISKVKKAEFWS